MVVLVCGGRAYVNADHVFKVLSDIHAKTPIAWLIHGAARGADTFGENWAKEFQIDYTGVPAQWDKYGRKAGPMRNVSMLNLLKNAEVAMVVAFPGGKGTAHMVKISKEAGLSVIEC